MFNDYPQISAGRECQPDPEEMLQRARKRADELKSTLDHFNAASKTSCHIPQRAAEGVLMAIGALTEALWNVEREVEQWLKEIDKE